MADCVLATLNARWAHCAFGLRYLMANLGALRDHAVLLEFDTRSDPAETARAILGHAPRIVGLGVYVWNVTATSELVAALRAMRPQVVVVLGGPQVSHETQQQSICGLADYVIAGEADVAFAELCHQVLSGSPPTQKTIHAPRPELAQLVLPYDLYTDQDIAHRVIYVETSRGCPFGCEFCLSSLDPAVRQFPLEPLLDCFDALMRRGARRFKFVDRTFNLSIPSSLAVLDFFRLRWQPGMFLHFEMVPDRLPATLRQAIAVFPAGCLQLELGIQTFDPEVAARINRCQNNAQAEDNLRFLRQHTAAYVHADLIAGLPGESLESFAVGFDRLLSLDPHEIQIELLKRLPGAPIVRHDQTFGMRYSADPPYEIVANSLIDLRDMQRLRRFARYWDLYFNSRNFAGSLPLLWGTAVGRATASPFAAFAAFADWLFGATATTHGLALDHLARLLLDYLVQQIDIDASTAAKALAEDYRRCRRPLPTFLRGRAGPPMAPTTAAASAPPRQSRSL